VCRDGDEGAVVGGVQGGDEARAAGAGLGGVAGVERGQQRGYRVAGFGGELVTEVAEGGGAVGEADVGGERGHRGTYAVDPVPVSTVSSGRRKVRSTIVMARSALSSEPS